MEFKNINKIDMYIMSIIALEKIDTGERRQEHLRPLLKVIVSLLEQKTVLKDFADNGHNGVGFEDAKKALNAVEFCKLCFADGIPAEDLDFMFPEITLEDFGICTDGGN